MPNANASQSPPLDHPQPILRSTTQSQSRPTYSRSMCPKLGSLAESSHQPVTNPPNLPWLVAFIRAIWDLYLSIWMDRCKHVNENKNDDPNSLTHTEKVLAIRHYLRIPRHHLSKTEKSLHFNISTSLKYFHRKTLTKWIGLLKEEREKTLRQPSMQTTKPQKRLCPITRYFKPTRKRTKLYTIPSTRHEANQRDKYPP